MFSSVYKTKKVVVTGNTGFKGSWLSEWLLLLGAEVFGISSAIPTSPSHFEILNLQERINHIYIDITDKKSLHKVLKSIQPDFIFHLAAQPIVSLSYKNPLETLQTNIIGTANIMEYLRLETDHKCIAVMITSDKCYENKEWLWGYRENDQLGGKDIYSSSKACAENVIYSYYHSFLRDSPHIVCSARAGNVIGGGDWAEDRIVVDCFVNWSEDKSVFLRSPYATRPWQHVLEPLSGYLALGSHMYSSKINTLESFNFGPTSKDATVLQLTTDLLSLWNSSFDQSIYIEFEQSSIKESKLLRLNCDKAASLLNWFPTLDYSQTIEFVSEWYKNFYTLGLSPSFTKSQILRYIDIASSASLDWTFS